MDEEVLENVYQENLDERIIGYLAEQENISYEQAMDVFYHSNLAAMIHKGEYGIQYLDYKVLTEMLIEQIKSA
ncbi:MAG: hypothetical protein VZQ80_01895 [Lachnospiraceae bacterium]|nr:hypothetical protein [Lachnospiraceae bacterium]